MKTRMLFWGAAGLLLTGCASVQPMPDPAEQPPRKVLLGSMIHRFRGTAQERYADVTRYLDTVAAEAEKKYPGRRLDLVMTTEGSVYLKPSSGPGCASARTLEVDDIVKNLGPSAKKHGTYLAVGALFADHKNGRKIPRNGVVLIDRQGKLAGLYRKVHLALDWDDPAPKEVENGMIPGTEFPVFDCDFGKVGFLVCYDMSYPDGWAELKKKGAEIVAVSTASPQTFRPAMFAHLHQYYVLTVPGRDNTSIFDPLGYTVSQVEKNNVPMVQEIDLSFDILHWSPTLLGGRKFTDAYGNKVGFRYKSREDNGIFWSNDPNKPIGQMIREQKLTPRDESAAAAKRLQDKLME